MMKPPSAAVYCTAALLSLTVAAKKPSATKPSPPPAAVPAPAPVPTAEVPRPQSDATVGKEVREIPLSQKQASRVHIVRTAPSYPVTIEFPEPFAAPPICGDCGEKGLYKIDVFNDGHYLTIKPRLFAGPQADGSTIALQDFVTVLTVRLQTYTLTIQVEYTDDASRADPRVVFTNPDRPKESAYVTAELEKARKKLEEEAADKVQRAVTTEFLHALMDRHSCASLSSRTRTDDLVLEAKELCIFGSRYYLRFLVENRGRATTEIGDVTLRAGENQKGLVDIAELDSLFATDRLQFSASTTGIAGYHQDDSAPPPRVFVLTVHERGGKGRQVNLQIEP